MSHFSAHAHLNKDKMKTKDNKELPQPIQTNPNTISISSPSGFNVLVSTDELDIDKTTHKALDIYHFLSEKLKEGDKENPSYTD